jgi:hypothetical protein
VKRFLEAITLYGAMPEVPTNDKNKTYNFFYAVRLVTPLGGQETREAYILVPASEHCYFVAS